MFDFIDHKEQINLLYGFFFASLQDDTLVSKNWISQYIGQMVHSHMLIHNIRFKVPHNVSFLISFKIY